ncbi:MAG TPA: hypothetical protein DCS21_05775 [Gammaproteobacteria bacterium]|nr:hypothetical protein [Gammaproteobacteria bacterium]
MLELAQADEWEIVTEKEIERRALIEALFQRPPPAEWVPLLKDTIQVTLSSDARVQELAHAEMDKLSDKLRTLKQGRRALSAYDDA